MEQQLYDHLAFLYGEEEAAITESHLREILASFRAKGAAANAERPGERLSEGDAILITYGDMVQTAGEAPLHTLARFLEQHVGDLVSTVHLLPFYPYSSDDGFAVVDYRAVDARLGSWSNVARIGRHFRLMFDAVINHISAESEWFQAFLSDEAPYRDYFTVVEPGRDLSVVFRPRALPLLTEVRTAAGKKLVWTTFGPDQIDLNYANPELLLDVVRTLLYYVAQGAEFIRLDAIAFMWKEIGTSCIHLPETHGIIKLLRSVLDLVAPGVVLVTETNVPHQENISYFGNGRDEAQMVYNFSLPPLVLHTFHTGDAAILSRWAARLETPSTETTFLHFLASHDGVGLTPAKGLLSEDEIQQMAQRVQAVGGYVSFKDNPDGSQSPYELNVNYLDALREPGRSESPELLASRFLAAQAIMLALQGVPGIYFHSLFGSRNWEDGVQESGRYRSINRQKLQRAALEEDLAKRGSLRRLVFSGYRSLLQARTTHPAFHPNAPQRVLSLHPAIFSLLRGRSDGNGPILCLQNVSGKEVALSIDLTDLGMAPTGSVQDLIVGRSSPAEMAEGEGKLKLSLPPYGVRWLITE